MLTVKTLDHVTKRKGGSGDENGSWQIWTKAVDSNRNSEGGGGGIRFALLPFAGQEGSKTYITRVGRSVGMIIAITSSVMRVTKKRYYLNRVKLLEKKPSCTLSADKYR